MLRPADFVRSYIRDKPGLIGLVTDVGYDYKENAMVAQIFWIESRATGRFNAKTHEYIGTTHAEARIINVKITEV